jgi:pyruvate dehydrogenase E2 component (dihydrolipoamide acetyltransferase)
MAELLRMPEVAANTTEAVLVSWPVPVDGSFRARDTLATVETAKATVDVEAEQDGVLLAALVAEGTEVTVGQPIALLGAPGERVTNLEETLAALGAASLVLSEKSAPDGLPEADGRPSAAASLLKTDGDSQQARTRVFSSPLARRLAREAGLDVDQIVGSGPNRRVVRRDVEAAISQHALRRTVADGKAIAADSVDAPSAPASSPAAFVDIPHTRLRRAMAARLLESKQTAPHFYVRGTARAAAMEQLRHDINEDGTLHVSLTDLIVKAVACAHRAVPEMNVIWLPDGVRSFSAVDVAMAVAVPGGLVTPVLRSVGALGIGALSRTAQDLVSRARAGGLQPRDLEGGTVTVTNLGMYGTEEFAAIINPPQSAILAVGAVREEPVVTDGVVSAARVMHLTLAVDHRPIDGVVAARWMQVLIDVLERPVRILV